MFEWNTLICLIDFELLVETCRDDKTIDGLVCLLEDLVFIYMFLYRRAVL